MLIVAHHAILRWVRSPSIIHDRAEMGILLIPVDRSLLERSPRELRGIVCDLPFYGALAPSVVLDLVIKPAEVSLSVSGLHLRLVERCIRGGGSNSLDYSL